MCDPCPVPTGTSAPRGTESEDFALRATACLSGRSADESTSKARAVVTMSWGAAYFAAASTTFTDSITTGFTGTS